MGQICPLLPYCILHMAAAGTGHREGGVLPAWSRLPSCHLKSICLPAPEGAVSRAEMRASQPPPSPSTPSARAISGCRDLAPCP